MAALPSYRANGGVRFTGNSAAGTTGTAGNPVTWADNATQPNLRFGDGTADRYVAAVTPTTVGDIATWNGTNWVRSPSPIALWWSPVNIANSGVVTAVDGASNNSVGHKIAFTQTGTCTGGRIYWMGGAGAQTITIDLWSSGVSVASGTVAVNAAGVYSVTFTSPYSVTSSVIGKPYFLTHWANSAHFSFVSSANWTSAVAPLPANATSLFFSSPWCYITNLYSYNAGGGHGAPDTTLTTNIALIEPTFTQP